MPGPGKITVLEHFPLAADTTIRLFNFDTGVARVKREHGELLAPLVTRLVLTPIARPFVHITGMASRAGDPEFNLNLSRNRARNVQTLLASLGVPPARLGTFDFVGEERSNPLLQENDEQERAVFIVITQNPLPPLPFPRPPLQDPRDPIVLTPQGLLKVQLRASLRGGTGIGPLNIRFVIFRIWDPVHLLACDYLYAAGEARVSLGGGGAPLGLGIVFEGPFNPINGTVPLGVHEFGGPARLLQSRLGLPSIFGGPRASRTILIMTPILAAFRPFIVNPLRSGVSAGGPSLVAAGFANGDMIAIPPGPFPFFGPIGAAAGPGTSADE